MTKKEVTVLNKEFDIELQDSRLNDSLAKELCDRAIDLSIDYSEIPLDLIINNDLIKEIPIVKTIFSLGKVGFTVKQMFFIKKLMTFLKEFQTGIIDDEKLSKFNDEMKTNDKYRGKVTNQILILLDRLLSDIKAKYLAKIFIAYIGGKYDWDTFTDLTIWLDSMALMDFKLFDFLFNQTKNIKVSHISEQLSLDKYLILAAVQRLRNYGFIKVVGRTLGQDEFNETIELSDFGIDFYRNCIKIA